MAILAEICTTELDELLKDPENRIADPLRLLLEFLEVDIFYLSLLGDLGCCFGRDDAEISLSSRERCFDIEVVLRAVLIRPDAAHWLRAEDVAEDGRID
jgi:hypothetical protein